VLEHEDGREQADEARRDRWGSLPDHPAPTLACWA
jgi:hypothetical protein